MNLPELARANAQTWLSDFMDEETKGKVRELLSRPDPKELIDRFYKNLEFGTGGLRGTTGVGPNCMNKYTVGTATQGLANYLKKALPGQDIKVAIAYDCRNNSKFFAQITPEVFSAKGITVNLFADLRPTPQLSFSIRHWNCHSAP